MKRTMTPEEWRATSVDLAIRHHERVFNDRSSIAELLSDADAINDYILLGAIPNASK
jgi:hypothetical protein